MANDAKMPRTGQSLDWMHDVEHGPVKRSLSRFSAGWVLG